MNANSLPKTPVIKDWLSDAVRQLRDAGIDSARLDAEIILTHTLRKSRTYLHAHPDKIIDARAREIADARLDLRLTRVPIAYIIGHKEFYGRRFTVTTATLIPRPESEALIGLLKSVIPPLRYDAPRLKVVDIGTGSGALGITAKLEFPDLDVTLTDVSLHALKIAQKNADNLGADVTTLKSDLLNDYPATPDIIIANLPYVDTSWERSPETDHEPQLALFAEDGGTHLIKKLITQSEILLAPGGYLILEADPEQHPALIKHAAHHGLFIKAETGYGLLLQKTTVSP
ncbi:MAG TPA: peptide chain release factor N(5)-glutamine methyltransferase [Candidatus Saccharimonadales bacterium]|nr:peptide chain release factor N(5)-glutamine methyltransferase [Candidatus Saccharimonadales bacterium]